MKCNYTSHIIEKKMFKRVSKTPYSVTPLNTCCEKIWWEVLHLHNIPTLPTPKADVTDPELGILCKFNRVKGTTLMIVIDSRKRSRGWSMRDTSRKRKGRFLPWTRQIHLSRARQHR